MASPSSSGTDVPPVLPSIPLSAEPALGAQDQSIGNLVRDVSTHLSALVRSEVELAKAEVSSEVKKGVQGSVFFLVALTIVLFSLFFFFFAIAELIAIWLPPAAAFAIVFGLQLLLAALAGLIGYARVRKIRKPERTISSLKESANLLNRVKPSPDGAAAPQLNGHAAARRT